METNNNFQIPQWIIKILGALIIVLVAFMLIQKGLEIGSYLDQTPENTISVSAEGRVEAIPDIAVVTLGIFVQKNTAKAAQDESSKQINQVIGFVKSLGVDEKDIKTSDFSINPRYDYRSEDSVNEVVGYDARQSVTVKVRGVDESAELVGKILDGATNNGANQINGVYFTFDDSTDLQQEARLKAISAAKQKAQELAEEAGIRLGKIVSISELGSYYPQPFASEDAMFSRGQGGGGASVAPDIEPGSTEITQTITVIFEVK